MKVVRITGILCVLALVCSGCSTIKTNELTHQESLSLKDKSLALSQYSELEDFAAQTAANVQFGLLGVASAISSGNTMVRNNNVEDPAYSIAKKLADGLRSDHNVNVVEVTGSRDNKNKVADLINFYADYEYVLDVKTIGWRSIYFPTDWDNYRVIYSAHARLIDVNAKQVVAEELCHHIPEYADTNSAPSYKDLESGRAISDSLETSIKYCVSHIQKTANFSR